MQYTINLFSDLGSILKLYLPINNLININDNDNTTIKSIESTTNLNNTYNISNTRIECNDDKDKFISNMITNKYNGKRNKDNILRLEVWYKRFKSSDTGLCFSCCNEIICIESSWHCGHIQAAAKKGPKTIDNLEPICVTCNLKMKKQHMHQYIVYNQLKGIKNLPDNKYTIMKPIYDNCKNIANELYSNKKITKAALEWFIRDIKTESIDHLNIILIYLKSLNNI